MSAANFVAGTPTPTGYLQIACTAWFLYDWALVLDDEVELVWRRRWSFTKVLFFLIRLTTLVLLGAETAQYVFLENLSESQCNIFSWALAISTAVVIVEVDLVLQLRVYVMYQRSRRLLWINGVLCLLNIACAAVILVVFFSDTHFVPVPPWIQGSCYDIRRQELGAVWVAPLFYELYLAVLAVYKVVRDHRLYGQMEGPSLLAILVRDSIVYFFLIAGAAGLNALLWSVTRVTPGDSAVNLIHTVGGIGGARIIISMRDAALRPTPLPTGDNATSTNFEMHTFKRPGRREAT